MAGVTHDNLDDYRRAFDREMENFVYSGNLAHFEAAKAVAVLIMTYEKTMSAYRHSFDLIRIFEGAHS